MNINKIVFGVLSVILISCTHQAETSTKSAFSDVDICRVAFYNTEKLFDAIDDKHTNDNDFLPTSKLKWTNDRYLQKVKHIKEVIDNLNELHSLALIGMAEVENKEVLDELLKNDSLFNSIHYNSSDKRGIDVCLIYNTSYFKPIQSYLSYFDKEDNPKLFLREVLVVKGVLLTDTVHILVNHWPSRREGQEKSEEKRIAAAMLTQEIIDSIQTSNPSSSIFVMGDFNDQPSDESMSVMLNVKETKKHAVTDLINPFKTLQEEGEGTCTYKRDWYLFDQILMTHSLTDKKGLRFVDAKIYDPDWLYYKRDLNSGPFRTYLGDNYYGGYSDHFPVYIELKR